MQELLEKLGIQWQLLLAQGVNFLIILFVLKKTAYGPLMKMLRERREKVEQGIRDADRAAEQLKDADRVLSEKVIEADKKSIDIITNTEKNAKEKEITYLLQAKEKERQIIASAEEKAIHIEDASREVVYKEAVSLVKDAVKKITERDPDTIDDTLVAQAIAEVRKMKTS